jgi:hypothetical protein
MSNKVDPELLRKLYLLKSRLQHESPGSSVDPELLRDVVSGPEEMMLIEMLAQHPELVPLLKEAMTYTPIPNEDALAEAIHKLHSAGSKAAAKRVIETHPELLTDEADILLARIISGVKSEKAIKTLEGHRELLARCRREGIDAAFSNHQ